MHLTRDESLRFVFFGYQLAAHLDAMGHALPEHPDEPERIVRGGFARYETDGVWTEDEPWTAAAYVRRELLALQDEAGWPTSEPAARSVIAEAVACALQGWEGFVRYADDEDAFRRTLRDFVNGPDVAAWAAAEDDEEGAFREGEEDAEAEEPTTVWDDSGAWDEEDRAAA